MYSKRFIVVSVLLHVLVIALLIFSVDFGSEKIAQPLGQKSEVVQAKVIDSKAVEREVKRLKAEEDKARLEKEKKVREAERKVREVEQQRRKEEQRVRELKAEQENLKRQEEVERKRIADTRRRAEEERKVAEAHQVEAQRKAEDARKAEAARKEAERKRVEETLQNEMAAEEAAQNAAARNAADENEITKYVTAISNSVHQSFTILPGLEDLSCTLRITLVPGGEVLKVEVVKSSGNPIFDRQAENAVRKAAPLPVPADPRLFQKMRSIAFVFRP